LEYGYKEAADADDEGNTDNNDWTVVDKSILESDDVPENVEKMIGFEGKPDPNSGKSYAVLLYCLNTAKRCLRFMCVSGTIHFHRVLTCDFSISTFFFINMNIRLLLCLQRRKASQWYCRGQGIVSYVVRQNGHDVSREIAQRR
jgi:hypothetical protein